MSRPPSQTARAKMLAATTDLVCASGVGALTIEEVARNSGVAKTTIYRHFQTRNQLLVAALDGALPTPPTPNTGSLRQDLLDFATSVVPIFADPGLRLVFLEITAAATRDPELRDLQQALTKARSKPLQTIYQNAVGRGELSDSITYTQAFDIVEGPLIVRALISPEELEDFDLESAVEHMMQLLSK
ncbi:MAG: TetR/AcrR family transcriptional regulator [Acidimicrobiales bacterium]